MGQRTCGQKAVNMVNLVSGNGFILVNKVYLVKCKKKCMLQFGNWNTVAVQ